MSNSKVAASNLLWRFLERFGAQGVTFVVSIILARILSPEIYGVLALVLVITTILQVFVDAGFSTALIQKKEVDDVDFSTVFYANIILCTGIYLILFFVSPFIASFYEIEELTSLLRVLGIIVLISGFKSVQISYVSRNLLFKKFFFATLGGTVLAAAVGIWMAYSGYGIWALVIQNIVNQTVDTLILWIVVKWKPKLKFSFKKLKSLWSFGWKMFVSSLINNIWEQLRQLIIGKKYSTEDLAFYNKGLEFPKYGTSALNTSIDSVLFPLLSTAQDSKENVKVMTRRSIKVASFWLWPMMIGLAVCSKPLVSLFLTDKWLFCVPYLQIFCIVYAFQPIHTANLSAIKAMGRSDYFLLLEIIKKVIDLIIILIAMWFGVLWLAISALIGCLINQLVNAWPNRKLLGYKYGEQLLDILPFIFLSVIMGAVVYCVAFFNLSNWLTLLIQIPLGIIIYISVAYLFKFETFTYCLNVAKSFLKKTKTDSRDINAQDRNETTEESNND